jgi:hypothetical protein
MSLPLSGPINLSGTILVGGASQILVRANRNRTILNVVNPDATNDLWLTFLDNTATPYDSGSIRIPANGGILSFNGDAPGTDCYIYGGITDQKFTAWTDA